RTTPPASLFQRVVPAARCPAESRTSVRAAAVTPVVLDRLEPREVRLRQAEGTRASEDRVAVGGGGEEARGLGRHDLVGATADPVASRRLHLHRETAVRGWVAEHAFLLVEA